MTPSELALTNGTDAERDVLRSPLAKRKKIALDRSGSSKLKEAITADELEGLPVSAGEPPLLSLEATLSQAMDQDGGDGREEEDEDEEDEDGEEGSDEDGAMDDDDDFLARELEAEWG